MGRRLKYLCVFASVGGIIGLGLFASWFSKLRRDEADEWILFSTSGSRPFEDSIYAVPRTGGKMKTVLKREQGRSFLGASGNSMDDKLVVLVHAINGERAEDRLFLYRRSGHKWEAITNSGISVGRPTLSPSGAEVLFTRNAESRSRALQVWRLDLESRTTTALTETQEGWDANPRWRPDGNAFAYLHIERTKGGLLTSLHQVDSRNKSDEILASDEGVVAFTYSPDGSEMIAWTKTGLQRINLLTKARKTIVPLNQVADFQILAGTLDWSRYSSSVAFAMHNRKQKRDEIWTAAADGNDAHPMFHISGSKITAISFIKP
jgi:dipeptidyl aminopeptidase/acylaminoacyl peptidase